MKRFKKSYRIASARLQKWDYGSSAAYFITICTKNRVHYFGEITERYCGTTKMSLSETGEIAHNCWKEIPRHFPFAHLSAFVIMPDHIHGIVTIDKHGAHGSAEMQTGGITGDKNPMLHQNLSRIIRWYKGRTAFECRKVNTDFAWHPRFHDHIIRNVLEYRRITEYIARNPENWKNRMQ